MKYKSPTPIAILLATYNGEKYIRELLLSLQQQTMSEWTLFVQDDGSDDGTVHILQNVATRDGRVIVVEPECYVGGAMRNFMSLLERVEADYYMFCDQDDVWLPEKIALTYGAMQRLTSERRELPIAVCTDLVVVDAGLNPISQSFWKMSDIKAALLAGSLQMLYVHNLATGCTLMINHAAKVCSLPLDKVAMMHDSWIVLCVAAKGGVIEALLEQTVLYRQHAANVLGAENHRGLGHVLARLASLRRVFRLNMARYRLARHFGLKSPFSYFYYKLRYAFS